jgi:hypothetical protein
MIAPDTLLAVRAAVFSMGSGRQDRVRRHHRRCASAHADVLELGHDVCLLTGPIDAHVHLAFNASADVVGGARRR